MCSWYCSSLKLSQLLFLYQERIPPGPRVGLWYTGTGEERAVGQAVGAIANWRVIRVRSAWRSGGAGVVQADKPVAIF